MSEASLNDVDKFLFDKGFEHVRYVDDFRIFSHTKDQLEALLQNLTVYLHENHRLSLNSSKTIILESDKFIQDELNNQYQQEKLQILDELEGLDSYSIGTQQLIEINSAQHDEANQLLIEALQKLLAHEVLDLGLVRAIVRRAKANKIIGIATLLLEKFQFIAPAINDVVLYLDAISTEAFLYENTGLFVAICDGTAVNLRVVRMWMEWYFSRHLILLNQAKIRSFIFASDRLRPQAQAAITLKSEAWIKERKTKLLHYAYWDRRSIILAASLLSKDEREKWLLPLLKGPSLGVLDKWMARWVIDGSPTSSSHLERYFLNFILGEFF